MPVSFNLLPWREQLQECARKIVVRETLVVLLFILVIVCSWHLQAVMQIKKIQLYLKKLQTELNSVSISEQVTQATSDKQKLQQQTQMMLVERMQMLCFLTEMNKIKRGPIFLQQLQLNQQGVVLAGKSPTFSAVIHFLQSLQKMQCSELAQIKEIKGQDNEYNFIITTQLSK